MQCFLGEGGLAFNMIHRAYRYGKDFPGLKGRDLSNRVPLAKDCPEFYKLYKTDQQAPPAKKPPSPKQ
jgi:hypothetical protein